MPDHDRRAELRPAVESVLPEHSAALQGGIEVLRTEVRLLLEAAGANDLEEVERRMETVIGSADSLKARAVGVRNIIAFLAEVESR